MSQTLVPRSVEELLREYDYYITGLIVKLSRQQIDPDGVADLKQEVALKLLRTGYLDRYDASKTKFSTYLYYLVQSVVVDAFITRRREAGTMVSLTGAGHWPKYDESDMTWVNGGVRALTRATFRRLADDSLERRQIATEWLDQFEAYLWRRASPQTPRIVLQGETVVRGLGLIFRLMREEKSSSEIAEALGMSVSNVSGCFRRIREEAQLFNQITGLRRAVA